MTLNSKLRGIEEYLKLNLGATPKVMPDLPSNTLNWISKARPFIGRRERNFDLFPYLIDVYEDNHPNILSVWGRQTFKTTTCTDLIGCEVTSKDGVEATYCVDNENHLSAFSKQRLRRETFLSNPTLAQFLPHGRANIGEITLENGSVAYLVTDEGEYKKTEGKSNSLLVTDETQYQDVQFLYKALYTLTQTRGKYKGFGIGGEAGSEYHKMWLRTDQREWVYEDPYWRTKLKFDSSGQIINSPEELKAILKGRWVAQKPENTQFRGYHIPQTVVPTIPLTIDDAIHKYNVQPELSIEYQQKYFPSSIYLSHTLAEFYKAERRPITPDMMYACMHPYRYLTLLSGEEVKNLKQVFNNQIRVLMGVDFGSGPSASSTVISIIIHWRKSGRYQLAYIDKRPQEHQLDQARYIANLGREYGIDFGVGDLGYGAIQVKVIQDGGRDSHDVKFEGLGKARFKGCRTIGDETKPNMEYKAETDEHGTETGRIQIDKTTVIQNLVDRIGQYYAHPNYPTVEEWKRPVLIIPYGRDYDVDWLVDDFCATTRKDLEQDQDVTIEDPRQKARKEFNHPKDSMMSVIYCFVADEHYSEDRFRISGVGKKRKRLR